MLVFWLSIRFSKFELKFLGIFSSNPFRKENEPILQRQRLPFRKFDIPCPFLHAEKIMEAKWIRGDESVISRVPSRWVTEVARVVEDHDAGRFRINGARIQNP